MASATTVYMTRNPPYAGASNTLNPEATQFKFFEESYASGTTQKSIYMPDMDGASVTLSLPVAGACTLEVTDSPPDVIEAGSGVWVTATAFSAVTASTSSVVMGATAIRANRTSGTVKISVRV